MAKEQENENGLKQAIINLSLETIRSVSGLDSSDVGYGDKLIGIAKKMREKSGKIIGDFSEADKANGKTQAYQMVDLGLPSGLKWADRNIGAENIEDYGDYFAWGETAPRGENWSADTPYDWAHAPFNNGSSAYNSTYFNAHKSEWLDGDVLKPEYDAATQIMGGSWKMPMSAEIMELIDGTTRSLETLNGVKGVRFTSKTNDNSIFMPFAGYRNGSDVTNVGNGGYAWSSSLDAGSADYSRSLGFDDGGLAYVSNNVRYDGFVVRGVHE